MSKKFVRAVYQEILVFYYFKNSIKRYPKWRECIFSNEIPKSFQGPKAGPRPHTENGSLCSHDAAAHCRKFRPVTIWAPPDQILDPPLENERIGSHKGEACARHAPLDPPMLIIVGMSHFNFIFRW